MEGDALIIGKTVRTKFPSGSGYKPQPVSEIVVVDIAQEATKEQVASLPHPEIDIATLATAKLKSLMDYQRDLREKVAAGADPEALGLRPAW